MGERRCSTPPTNRLTLREKNGWFHRLSFHVVRALTLFGPRSAMQPLTATTLNIHLLARHSQTLRAAARCHCCDCSQPCSGVRWARQTRTTYIFTMPVPVPQLREADERGWGVLAWARRCSDSQYLTGGGNSLARTPPTTSLGGQAAFRLHEILPVLPPTICISKQ